MSSEKEGLQLLASVSGKCLTIMILTNELML